MYNSNTNFPLTELILFELLFSPAGFYNVPRVLIVDARSFQALAAVLD